jgi:hypothetical protein
MAGREMAFVACWNGICRLENNAVNAGHRRRAWYRVLILCDNCLLSFRPRVSVVGLVGEVSTIVQPTGSRNRWLSDKITTLYVYLNSCDLK